MAIIALFFNAVEENFWLALLYAILFYIATATVVLSPVGEWAFRLFNGCKKIKAPALLNRLEPLFMEVKERAQTKHDDFIVDDRINLYICEDESINAFAMGRRTICVTHGLLSLSDEEIKELSKLPRGVAAVFQNNWLETALVKIHRAPDTYQQDVQPVEHRVLAQIRGAAAICEEELRLVETDAPTSEDFRRLEDWQNHLSQVIRRTVAVDGALVPFFTRLMIFAKANTESDSRYLSAYELLYETPAPREVPSPKEPVEAPAAKVM